MTEQSNKPFRHLVAAWANLGWTQRSAALGLTVLGLLVIILSARGGSGSGEEMKDLCGKIEDRSQVVAIVEALEKAAIRHRLSDDGHSIMVDATCLSKAMSVVLKTVRRGGDRKDESSGIFGGSLSFCSSRSLRDNGTRRQEEELERTIEYYSAVRLARVHITVPNHRLFASRTSDSSASVFLKLHSDASLTKCQIHAIKALVANSVEGLKKENISITDSRGTDYAAMLNDEAGEGEDGRLDAVSRVEAIITEKIKRYLQDMFGPEHVTVTVSARVDMRRLSSRIRPSNVTIEMCSLSTKGRAKTAVGTSSAKLFSYLDVLAGLCVSVCVDSALFGDKGMPDQLRRSIEKSISLVARLDESRGDRVSIIAIPFARRPALTKKPLLSSSARYPSSGLAFNSTFACIGALLLLSIVLAVLVARRRAQARRMAEDAMALSGAFNITANSNIAESGIDWVDSGLQEDLLRETAEREPEVIARLIRTIGLDSEK